MMNYVILDMEWNQPYSSESMIRKPIKLCGEIIQIGAVKLDESYCYADSFKMNIRPKYYKKINRYVAKLTKIANEDLKTGLPFSEACEEFLKWCGDDFVFLTWGADDFPMLRDNMLIHGLNPDVLPKVFNLQVIFCSQKLEMFRQVSLSEAMLAVNAQMLEAHDALNDSMSAYEICKRLDLEKGIAEYENNVAQMIGKKYKTEEIGKLFSCKKEVFSDSDVMKFKCPECGEEAFCEEAVAKTKGKSISVAKCKNGDSFFVKFRFVPKKGGRLAVFRTLKTLKPGEKAYYYQKKALAESKKRTTAELKAEP